MKILKWVLVTGSPSDGFSFIGPFTDHDAALRYGDQSKDAWWVTPIVEPSVPGELNAQGDLKATG